MIEWKEERERGNSVDRPARLVAQRHSQVEPFKGLLPCAFGRLGEAFLILFKLQNTSLKASAGGIRAGLPLSNSDSDPLPSPALLLPGANTEKGLVRSRKRCGWAGLG